MTLALRCCAAVTLTALFVLAVTGILLGMHYVPVHGTAAASVRAIEADVVGGTVVRALHHHATTVLLVASLAWCGMLAWTWRDDRRQWWAVTGMAMLAFVGAWTGRLLPDDHYAQTSRSVMQFGLHEGHGGTIVGTLLGLRSTGTSAMATTFAMHALVGLAAVIGLLLWLRTRVAWRQAPEQWSMAVGLAVMIALGRALPLVIPGTVADVDPSRPWWMFLPLHHLSNALGAELASIFLWGLAGIVAGLPWWVGRVRPAARRAGVIVLGLVFVGLLLA
jgi:hypothetical protein